MAYTEKQKLLDYKAVFGSDAGRRVLADLVATHGLLKSSPNLDPQALAFHAGEREVVIGIIHYLNLKPSDLPDAAAQWAETMEQL
jgi:hypothetical protein